MINYSLKDICAQEVSNYFGLKKDKYLLLNNEQQNRMLLYFFQKEGNCKKEKKIKNTRKMELANYKRDFIFEKEETVKQKLKILMRKRG